MTQPQHLFRAFWPIYDDTIALEDLIQLASQELPMVAARAHAETARGGRWSIQPSVQIPGSGRITPNVLVLETPGRPKARHPRCLQCNSEVDALVDGTSLCLPCDSLVDDAQVA